MIEDLLKSFVYLVNLELTLNKNLTIFDDMSLMLNARRLCVVVDSLIVPRKSVICVISAWC